MQQAAISFQVDGNKYNQKEDSLLPSSGDWNLLIKLCQIFFLVPMSTIWLEIKSECWAPQNNIFKNSKMKKEQNTAGIASFGCVIFCFCHQTTTVK